VYPDRGSVIRELPTSAAAVNYAGVSYRFSDGVWYEPRGPAYMVVEPPIGVLVPTLPQFVTPVASAGTTYLYANDTYYRARPDLGGYEVVNDPADSVTAGGPSAAPLTGGALPSQVPVPITSYTGAVDPAAAAATGAVAGTTAAVVAGAATVPTQPAVLATQAAAPAAAGGAKPMLYPKNGQTPEQQERDRYECYHFASAQTGFDPMHAGSVTTANAGKEADYERAQSACFDAKGYATR
jgi:hypothetical protein